MCGKDALEHEFVTNGDTANVICAIHLNSLLNYVFLAVVRSTTVGRNYVVSKIDRDVHFCLSNSLQLIIRLSAFYCKWRAVEGC